ncbi:MAG TPA: TIGR01777 family oxidoreductase [Planctomycetaceae bacterium]|nr:TIGR01777 family oxidoreductase [Planctomycetaceae bacterium]
MSRALVFERRVLLPVSAEAAFAWHERPGAFQRLSPPWEPVELLSHDGIRDGARAELRMRLGPVSQTWIAEHRDYRAGQQFRDVQLEGPFAKFEHTHRFTAQDHESCWLNDHIEYIPPFGTLGRMLAGRMIRKKLDRVFRYRHHVTTADLTAWSSESATMKVLVTGATGLVGRELIPLLTTSGHEVFRLVRRSPSEANDIPWDPQKGEVHKARLEGLDGVVHLAGENIAGARWNATVKQRLRDSRTGPTRLLCETLASLERKPKVLVCASAIGYYGDRGSEILTEQSAAGDGFLAEVCQDWEAACEPARQAGIRVVNLRIGVVLTPKGGALAKMLLPFKMGGGGVVGSGRQYWSWVAIDDVIGAIQHCLTHDQIIGPVNATAPNPATNYEFTKTLGAVLHRPTIFPMPGFAAKLALGEMADDLLLASTRVMPNQLQAIGYQFRCPTLESTLRHVLGK